MNCQNGCMKEKKDKLNKNNIEDMYMLTPLQEGILYHYLTDGINDSYLVQVVIKVKGTICYDIFCKAWNKVVQNNSILRTIFRWENIRKPVQIVLKEYKLDIEQILLENSSEKEVENKLYFERQKGIDIRKVPFKVRLFSCNSDIYYMTITNHHILLDGWSSGNILREFIVTYLQLNKNSYVDNYIIKRNIFKEYVKFLMECDREKEELFWKEYLKEFSTPIMFPKRKCEEEKEIYKENSQFSIASDILNCCSRKLKTSVATIIYALWTVLNYKYTDEQDILFGTTVSTRPETIRNIEDATGLFINTIPLRVKITGENTFEEIVMNVKKATDSRRLFEYSSVDKIKKYAGVNSRGEMFDSIVVVENYPIDLKLKKIDGLEIYDVNSIENNNYGINLSIVCKDNCYEIELICDNEKYSKDYRNSLIQNFQLICEQCIQDIDIKICDIEWVNQKEKEKILVYSEKKGKVTFDYNISIKLWFEEIVKQYSEKEAISYLDKVITYSELNGMSNGIAKMLLKEGIQKEDLVAIYFTKSERLILSIMAVIKAGGAFMLIDPELPDERIRYYLKNSNVKFAISDMKNISDRRKIFDEQAIKIVELSEKISVEHDNLSADYDSDNLLYVVYTSGTTGNPKGVKISNKNLVLYMKAYFQDVITPTSEDASLGLVPISFDLFLEELFVALLTGAKFVIPTKTQIMNVVELAALIERENVTLVSCSPLLLNQFNSMPPMSSIKYFINGGDVLEYRYISNLIQYSKVYNGYGPAEATIGAIFQEVKEERITLGKSLSGYKIYILDKDNHIVPFYQVGEICIAGDAVSKGYLYNREETEKRFINSPFHKDEIIYKTGDLGFMDSRGEYHFQGRNDRQIKIHGFRIELGEIEHNILELDEIDDVTVTTQDINGRKSIIAFYVSKQNIDKNIILDFLQKRLPEYMIPSKVVLVNEIERNANGKVIESKLVYNDDDIEVKQKPQTILEHTIAKLWAEALKIQENSIGVDDNYFEIGGDSIISMQIVYQLNQLKYTVSVSDIIEYPTIRLLADKIEKNSIKKIVQSKIEYGVKFELTPIQESFFKEAKEYYNQWNQAMFIELGDDIDSVKMKNSINYVFNCCKEFDLRFTDEDGIWSQYYDYKHKKIEVKEIDLSEVDEISKSIVIEQYMDKAHRAIRIKEGILWQAYFFKNGMEGKNQIFIAIHHLVVDGVSWRILLTKILNYYKNQRNIKYSGSYLSDWVQVLVNMKNSDWLVREIKFWKNLEIENCFLSLPQDFKQEKHVVSDMCIIDSTLGREKTAYLQEVVRNTYKVSINDFVFSAISKTLSSMCGGKVLIDIEGHGREQLEGDNWDNNVDLSNSIGWYTLIFPFLIDFDTENNDFIYDVKLAIRRAQRHGLGYALATQKTDDLNELQENLKSTILFSYLGIIDSGDFSKNGLKLINTYAGHTRDGRAEAKYLIEMDVSIYNGDLHLSIYYNAKNYKKETIVALQNTFMEILLDESVKTKKRRVNFTRFSDTKLCKENIDISLKDIDAIYPLTPVQEGMVFHTVYAQQSSVALEQSVVMLDSECNISILECAWNQVIENNESLRTSFHFYESEQWIQIVHRHVKVVINEVICSDDEEFQIQLDEFLDEDRRRKLEIEKVPIMRLTVLRHCNQLYMVWTYHHIQIDGWSIGGLFEQLCKIYQNLLLERQCVENTVSLKEYFLWRKLQDEREAKWFWKDYLGGIGELSKISDYISHSNVKDNEKESSINIYKLDNILFEQLLQCSSIYQVTISILIQAAWALTLHYYTGCKEAIYGVTSAGRPTEIKNVDKMIGCLMNTLPLRVKIEESKKLRDWLLDIQKMNQDIRRYEFVSLAMVRECMKLDRDSGLYDIYDSIVIVENYPFDEKLLHNNNLIKEHIAILEELNYPLTLYCNLKGEKSFKILYDPNIYSKYLVDNIYATFYQIIQNFFYRVDTLRDINYLSEREKKQFQCVKKHERFTQCPYDNFRDMFVDVVEKYGNRIAVVDSKNQVTYDAIDIESDCISYALKTAGVEANTVVSILISRNYKMIAAMIAILKIGCAFNLIDSEYPEERISYILEESKTQLLLTIDKSVSDKISKSVKLIDISCTLENINMIDKNTCIKIAPENLAYIIYTSGSSGKAKGVMVDNKAFVAHISDMIQRYSVTCRDNILQFSALSFDISLEQIFVSLLSGASLCMRGEDVWTPFDLKKKICQYHISVANLPTAYWNQVVNEWKDEEEIPKCLRLVIVGGEQMLPEYAYIWKNSKSLKKIQLMNAYGPAETIMTSTLYEVPDDFNHNKSLVHTPVGYVLANRRISIMKNNKPVPYGMTGMVYFEGTNISKGYINNEQLTEVAYEFKGNSIVQYCSGDLGRFLPNGELEIVGRSDNQVKIRSFRIEIDEVESALIHTNLFKEVSVIVSDKDDTNDKFLVAYVVLNKNTELDMELINKTLVSYMIPRHFVILDSIPKTINGKIDKHFLKLRFKNQDYMVGQDEEVEECKTDLEMQMQKIWTKVLGNQNIGRNSNFFVCGGDSLKAMKLMAIIRNELSYEVMLKTIFEAQTLQKFCKCIDNRVCIQRMITKARKQQRYELSPQQKRIFIAQEMNQSNSSYNIPLCIQLNGKLDVERLRESFDILVQRHDSLRTSFEIYEGKIYQRINENVEYSIAYQKIDKSEDIQKLIHKVNDKINLIKAPLFRVAIYEYSENEFVLVIVVHHIICDGVSIGVMISQLQILYNNEIEYLPNQNLQYVDFVEWQRKEIYNSEKYDKAQKYWLNLFQGELPVINLYRRNGSNNHTRRVGMYLDTIINDNLILKIDRLCKKYNFTKFDFMLAAYYILLYRYTSEQDIVIGVPTSGRIYAEVNDIIGMFVNTLPIRNFIQPDEQLLDFLSRVHDRNIEAFENQIFQLESLISLLDVTRVESRNPLFDVTFVYQNMENMELTLRDLSCKYIEVKTSDIKYDLTVKVYDNENMTKVFFIYDIEYFSEKMVKDMLNSYLNILQIAVEQINVKISSIPMNSRYSDYSGFSEQRYVERIDRNLNAILHKNNSLYQNNIICVDETGRYTYGWVFKKSNDIAHELIEQDCKKGYTVGISTQNSVYLLASVMAVVRIGAVFLPIDYELPEERIYYMIRDSGTNWILTDCQINYMNEQLGCKVIKVNEIVERNEQIEDCDDSYNLPLYLIYTSGTSGKPKAVSVTRNNIYNYYLWLRTCFTNEDITILLSSYSYDLSYTAIFSAILCGSCIHLQARERYLNIKSLIKYLNNNKITIIKITPSFFHHLLNTEEFKDIKFSYLERVILGGESYIFDDLELIKEIHPNIKIINHYGPTETTVGVLIHPLDNMDDLVKNNIVIGKPICNVDVRILDENKNDVPMYGIGELYISGASVSNGYINQTELTKERFCKLENQNVWYSTGDLVRWNEEGLILYEGRKDTQVKIRGYRVEMSEIEKSLRVIEGITDAYACILQETGEKELVAFYVAPNSISQNTFMGILSHKLPIYMVPNRYIRVNNIPLLMNGKVDTKKLNSYKMQVQDSVEMIYPQNDMQRKVYMIWKKVITNKNFGIRDNFFNIGGDSIKAVQVISLLNSYDVKLHDIYHYQTIEDLSAYLINRKSGMNVEISTCKIDAHSVDTIMNKIVYSVQPFNDLYYQSCYYNAFFSLAQYWEKDIIHIMTNDTIHYNILNVENKLNFEVLYTYSEIINVVIEKYGIGLNAYLKCDKLSQSIVAALAKKRMIIVRVDCFYEPLREEMFQKQHWAHYLLVIGYDLEKKLFYVLEHSGINELDYTVQNISFFDLEKAYYGYCEYFCNNNVEVPTYFEFCKRQEQVYLNSAINNFKLVINKNIDTYRNNMEVIGRLDQFLQNIIVEEEMISHVTLIYSGINNLMLSKKALFYILNKLLKPKEELLSMADNLRYKINIINGKLMKSMVKGSMSNKEWKGFVLKFKEYAEKEIEFLDKMIQFSETID